MAKQESPISIRLDDVHKTLLETMINKLKADGIKTNRSDMIQKAIYFFARDKVLGSEEVSKIIDSHYGGIHKD